MTEGAALFNSSGWNECFGDEGIRTPDIRVANAALYQLSYVPEVPVLGFAER